MAKASETAIILVRSKSNINNLASFLEEFLTVYEKLSYEKMKLHRERDLEDSATYTSDLSTWNGRLATKSVFVPPAAGVDGVFG